MSDSPHGRSLLLSRRDLDALINAWLLDGYRVTGPTLRGRSIELGELESAAALPAGWTTHQGPGTCRLSRRDDAAVFGFAVGQSSFKEALFVPELSSWRARQDKRHLEFAGAEANVPKTVLLGVRACDLAAIDIQDRIFLDGPYADLDYAARRQQVRIIAVNCGVASGTCFCASMGTGPRVTGGFDLCLTELVERGPHRFVVEVGSDDGAGLLSTLHPAEASATDSQAVEELCADTVRHMGRSFDNTDIRGLLYGNLEHPRWDDVAGRCLTCTNCTLVCPTCFCAEIAHVIELGGVEAGQRRRWDSCFTLGHSYVHPGSVRASARARYRQWLVHKVAAWIDQFGCSGCVGCGRCITWCPVGIDITEEVAAIRKTDQRRAEPVA